MQMQPPPSRSDHNIVRLCPKYVPLFQRQDCFDCKDWDALTWKISKTRPSVSLTTSDFVRKPSERRRFIFRRKGNTPETLRILDRDVEFVEEYKYLGVTIDNQLNWRANSMTVYKKGCSRLFPEETEIL